MSGYCRSVEKRCTHAAASGKACDSSDSEVRHPAGDVRLCVLVGGSDTLKLTTPQSAPSASHAYLYLTLPAKVLEAPRESPAYLLVCREFQKGGAQDARTAPSEDILSENPTFRGEVEVARVRHVPSWQRSDGSASRRGS